MSSSDRPEGNDVDARRIDVAVLVEQHGRAEHEIGTITEKAGFDVFRSLCLIGLLDELCKDENVAAYHPPG